MKGMLGVALAFILIASLLVFAVPTSAQPYGTKDNAWESKEFVAGMDGGWLYDPGITSIGPIAKDKDGATIYAYVQGASPPARTAGDFFVSKDGYSWTTSNKPDAWKYGTVVDMACSSRDLETIYATDGNYVYKSVDGAMNWSIVAQENLELFLMGDCGIPIVGYPITCIDVGYNAANEPILFIGTRNADNRYPAGHENEYQAIVGTVLWINEETYPAEWYDLGLNCYGCCDISTVTDVAAEVLGWGGVVDGELIDLGDGGTSYSGTLSYFPLTANSLTIVAGGQVVTDDGGGGFTGDCSAGSINYTNGDWSVTFNSSVSSGVGIRAYYTGAQTDYTGTLVKTPIDADTVVITDNDTVPQVLEDDAAGIFTGDGSGTVDFETGAYAVSFNTAPTGDFVYDTDTGIDTADDVYAYSGSLPTLPAPTEVVPGTLILADDDGDEVFTDNGDGTLTGNQGGDGTIDYTDGSWTLNYGVDPGGADDIDATYAYGVPITAAYTYYSGGPGCFDAFSVAAAPNFADTGKAYVLVSRPTTMTFNLNEPTGFVRVYATSDGATLDYTTLPDEITIDISDSVYNTDDGSVVTLYPGSYCDFECDGTGTGTADVQFSVTAGQIDNIVCPGADCAYATVCEAATQVISTVGTTCSWNFVSELFWDCDSYNNFEIRHGSRFAFPDDFADANELFVGVTGVYPYGPGGDVYSTTDTPGPDEALDRNVQGFSTGCLGFYHANICSLDMKGSAADGSLIAGAYDTFEHQSGTDVFYSSDGGWTWAASKKDPTGVALTYVLWFGSTAVAGTYGCDCGFSMSCGDVIGEYWNQTSLIAICITDRQDMDQSPEYVDGSSTVYMLFYCNGDVEGYNCGENTSLFRYDGVHWERVFSSSTYYAGPDSDAQMDWVEVSPDFNTTGCLYLASEDFQMYRSMDRGCNWAPLSYPCEPRPDISAWIVVDEETVLAAGCGGAAGVVFKTTRHGTRPWDEFPIKGACCGVDFDLSPNIGSDGQVLLGDACGQVFISEDVGSTWDKVWKAPGGPPCNVLPSANTYVQFDPSYGTGSPDAAGINMIYAAAGNIIARCAVDIEALGASCWEKLNSSVCQASGIDAHAGTALYVSDGAATMEAGSWGVTATGQVSAEWTGEDWLAFDWYPYEAVKLPLVGTIDLIDAQIEHIQGDFLDDEVIVHISDVLTTTGFNRYWAISFDDIDYGEEAYFWNEGAALSGKVFVPPDVEVEVGIWDDTTMTWTPGVGGTYDPVTGYFSLDAYDPVGDRYPELNFYGIGFEGYAYIFVPITDWDWDYDYYGDIDTYFWPGFPFPAASGTIGVKGSYSEATGDITLINETVWLPPDVWATVLDNWDMGGDDWMNVFLEQWLTGVVRNVVSTNLISSVYGGAGPADCTRVWRTLNPLDFIPPGVPYSAIIEWEQLTDATLQGANAALVHGRNTTQTDNLWLTTNGASNVLWCLDANNRTYVWNWSDPLANPVILSDPGCGSQLVSPGSVTLSWAALDAATEYEIELYQYCPQCPDEKLAIDVPNSTDTCVIVEGLAPGTEHFWRVRVAMGAPYLSKWSELCSFTTALGQIPYLCSPVCGAENVILNTNFSWDEVPGAASYELQIVVAGEDGTADFTGAETLTTDVNALASIPGLEYSTTYYWRVRAITGSVPGAWAVCIFTTMGEPEEPVPPADLVVNIPEDEVITPTWMWVLIGIGAALTIAVVILIVTTRRVP
jgi:hypothetical protein